LDSIVVVGVGAFLATEDPDAPDAYYLVQWVDEPRTLYEDLVPNEFDQPILLKSREMVVRAKYFNKVRRATRWYTPSTILTTVWLQQVLIADLEIQPESPTSKLPNTCNKVAARSKGARKSYENDHDKIVDAIAHRAILDFYEEEDNNDDDDDGNDDDDDDNDPPD
jgi:hypothetical protein